MPGMAEQDSQQPTDRDIAVADVLEQLDNLEERITTEEARAELHEARSMLAELPGSRRLEERITKYTTRDMGEAFVGSIIFALPLLVEGGVFEIASYFVERSVAGVPVFLFANIVFVVALTTGLLYAVDFREIQVSNPIFGIIPRRLTGVLLVSLLTTAGLMLMWGRAFEEDPTTLEAVGRVTVIWAAAALGASLGDILPGESKGIDLTRENVGGLIGDDK